MKFAKNMQGHVFEDGGHDGHGPEAIWSFVDGPFQVQKFAYTTQKIKNFKKP